MTVIAKQRDQLIFTLCRDRKIPVVWNLAGGYQRDQQGGISRVLELHEPPWKSASAVSSMQAAMLLWNNKSVPPGKNILSCEFVMEIR